MKYTYLFLALSLVGCDAMNFQRPAHPMHVASADPDVQVIVDSMHDMSKADCEVMRKLFVGLEQYLPNGKRLDTTPKVFKLIQDVQDDYGYGKGKYVAYTDAVEKYLKGKGYDMPHKIVDGTPAENEITRAQLVSDIKVLADAAKIKMNEVK